MNTKDIQQRQAQLALYIDIIEQADKFCGNNSTMIQLTFPHNQEHATQLHNDFIEAFEPFRKHLVECATFALKELCPDMAEKTMCAFASVLDRAADKGQYADEVADEVQHIIAEENNTTDSRETINPK